MGAIAKQDKSRALEAAGAGLAWLFQSASLSLSRDEKSVA